MKATVLDLWRRMKDVIRALDRNEPVTLLYRGRKKGVLYPVQEEKAPVRSVKEHPAFGLWKDREDTRDVERAVRRLRKGRSHAL
jgi:hypothetical protein